MEHGPLKARLQDREALTDRLIAYAAATQLDCKGIDERRPQVTQPDISKTRKHVLVEDARVQLLSPRRELRRGVCLPPLDDEIRKPLAPASHQRQRAALLGDAQAPLERPCFAERVERA